jgi:hypothetical protein
MGRKLTAEQKAARQAARDAERVKHDCPHCGARASFACSDYKGQPAPLCVERGRPEITAKKLAKKAAEKNTKALAEFGGDSTLLTYLHDGADNLLASAGVTKVTAEDVAAQKLRDVRHGVERCGDAEHACVTGLNWIIIRHMRRVAAELIGAEWERILWEGAFGTYGTNLLYTVTRYQQILCTTDKVVLGYERKHDPARAKVITLPPNEYRAHSLEIPIDGWYAAPTGTWPPEGYAPVMTKDEFNERFKLHHMSVRPIADATDDPSGLFDRTVATIQRSRSA